MAASSYDQDFEQFTTDELRQLYAKATWFNSSDTYDGEPKLNKCHYLYRNKNKVDWDQIQYGGRGRIPLIMKDHCGDPKNPLNGNLEGIFFCANVNWNDGDLPSRSPFGDTRWMIPISEACQLMRHGETERWDDKADLGVRGQMQNDLETDDTYYSEDEDYSEQQLSSVDNVRYQGHIYNQSPYRFNTMTSSFQYSAPLYEEPLSRSLEFTSMNLEGYFNSYSPQTVLAPEGTSYLPITQAKFQVPNLYFADFYCMNTPHYVILVMTNPGSEADEFCQENLLKIDFEDNPFFCYSDSEDGPSFWVSKKTWVEVFYTEELNLNHGEFSDWKFQEGGSGPGVKPKIADCAICNLRPDFKKQAQIWSSSPWNFNN